MYWMHGNIGLIVELGHAKLGHEFAIFCGAVDQPMLMLSKILYSWNIWFSEKILFFFFLIQANMTETPEQIYTCYSLREILLDIMILKCGNSLVPQFGLFLCVCVCVRHEECVLTPHVEKHQRGRSRCQANCDTWQCLLHPNPLIVTHETIFQSSTEDQSGVLKQSLLSSCLFVCLFVFNSLLRVRQNTFRACQCLWKKKKMRKERKWDLVPQTQPPVISTWIQSYQRFSF